MGGVCVLGWGLCVEGGGGWDFGVWLCLQLGV